MAKLWQKSFKIRKRLIMVLPIIFQPIVISYYFLVQPAGFVAAAQGFEAGSSIKPIGNKTNKIK